jgi:TolB-like protein
MQLRFLWKDGNSGGGGCLAVYEAEGGYVLQGKVLDAETRAQLRQLAGDEDAVFVPANVIDRLRRDG